MPEIADVIERKPPLVLPLALTGLGFGVALSSLPMIVRVVGLVLTFAAQTRLDTAVTFRWNAWRSRRRRSVTPETEAGSSIEIDRE